MTSRSPLPTHDFFASLALTAALAAPCLAQSSDSVLGPVLDRQAPDRTVRAVPGERPGTERWIVHFEKRSFDLAAYRAEMHGARNPVKVARIVADLEHAMREDQRAFVQAVQGLGGEVTDQFWLINSCVVEIHPSRLDTLRDLPNVAQLEADEEHELAIKSSINSKNHRTSSMHSGRLTGRGIGIAIVDTGQDENMNGTNRPHRVYRDRSNSSTTRLVLNKKIGAMSKDDVHGHGTAVASIAAGAGWSAIKSSEGHAFDAKICGYAIANDAKGFTSFTTKIRAYEEIAKDAAAYSIRVTNTSYSGDPSPTSGEQRALDSLAYNADIVNVTAAGNSGGSTFTSMINTNGISVGAVKTDSHELASFSSRGLTDGQIFPDLCANGVAIDMAQRDAEGATNTGSGTSMSSPQVAGIVAVLRAARPGLKVNTVRALMLATAGTTPQTRARLVHGPGAGYADAVRPWQFSRTRYTVGDASVSATPAWEADVALSRGAVFQFAIAWMRSDMSSRIWSNLDLELWLGNQRVAHSRTARNTEEFIRHQVTTTGRYRLRVVPTKLTGARQGFSWASMHAITVLSPLPDLRVETLTGDATVGAGSIALVEAVVRNSGRGTAKASRVVFTYQPNGTARSTDTLLWWVDVPALAGEQSYRIRGNVPIPAYVAGSTTGSIGLFVDIDDDVEESSEFNNGRTRVVRTNALPDGARRIDFVSRYEGDLGPRSGARAKFDASEARRLRIWLTTKATKDKFSVLLLSSSPTFKNDAFTSFGLGLLNSPVFASFFRQRTALSLSTINWPGKIRIPSDLSFYLHGYWFDDRLNMTGSSPRALRLDFQR